MVTLNFVFRVEALCPSLRGKLPYQPREPRSQKSRRLNYVENDDGKLI